MPKKNLSSAKKSQTSTSAQSSSVEQTAPPFLSAQSTSSILESELKSDTSQTSPDLVAIATMLNKTAQVLLDFDAKPFDNKKLSVWQTLDQAG